MKPQNAKRVSALEAVMSPPPLRLIRQFVWDAGQPFADAVAANDAKNWDTGCSLIVFMGVAADNGRPVPDPVRERDKAVADAWFDRFVPIHARDR